MLVASVGSAHIAIAAGARYPVQGLLAYRCSRCSQVVEKTSSSSTTTELEPARIVKEDATNNDFSTGYSGRGPLNLAKSLLADLYDEETAQEYGMALRDNLTRELDRDFEITAGEIDEVFQDISS